MWTLEWDHLALLLLTACRLAAGQILNLEEQDPCRLRDGRPGICKLLTACPDPGDFRSEQPPICTFKGLTPVICCLQRLTQKDTISDTNTNAAGPKAKRFCETQEDACNARWDAYDEAAKNEITRHVLNGIMAQPKDHVHMALIGYGRRRKPEWGCGGSLITAKYVLSAAHCISPSSLGPAKWARLGDLDISTADDDANTQERQIVERLAHPEFKPPAAYHDLALFRLDKDVDFTLWVSPACLHSQRGIAEKTAIVTGWGRVDFAGEQSKQLLEAELDVYNDTECRRLNTLKDDKTPRGLDSSLMFCAGKSDGSKDACSGDSGGPLVLKKTGRCLKTQIGITSYGNMCGLKDSPGVYTRVSQYISWIESVAFADT